MSDLKPVLAAIDERLSETQDEAEAEIGSSVWLRVNGEPVEFVVTSFSQHHIENMLTVTLMDRAAAESKALVRKSWDRREHGRT